jgi:hypothetical protein
METALIVGTLKILSPQSKDALVIPPEEKGNNDVESPSTNDLTPNSLSGDIEWRHRHKSRQSRLGVFVALSEIKRYHNTAADDAQENENIPAHLSETQEYGGI